MSNIAYNVVNGLCTPRSDQSAPVYITIGDGGNLEGLIKSYSRAMIFILFDLISLPFLILSMNYEYSHRLLKLSLCFCLESCRMTQPQPAYSAYREASFGHGTLDIKNRTHAYFAWHRNQDGYAVEADSLWLHNRYWHPSVETSSAAAL